MTSYVINNTPELKSKKKKNEVPEPPFYLVLMPFQPPAKLFFENIKIGQESRRILKIRNPSDNLINVVLDKLPDPKIGLTLSHTEFSVDVKGEFIVEIVFKPLIEGSSRECIHVKDANKNKKMSDIFINWNSINPNPQKVKKPKKPLTLETKILAQSKVIGKKTHVKNPTIPQKPLWKSSYGCPAVNSTVSKSRKTAREDSEDLPPCNVPSTPTRRQTYNVEDKENLDMNCGIYSNTQKRSPRLGRNTVLSPLPLLTTGRLKTKQHNKHENTYSVSSPNTMKMKNVQTIRNLQVSEDILHLGPSDEEEDVLCHQMKTFSKQNNQDRRDTYFVNDTTYVNHALPNQTNTPNRRTTYHVEFVDTPHETHAQPILPDTEFTGHLFIEEEHIRETKITRTPARKRNSFGKRGSWGEGDASFEDRRSSIEIVNGKLRIKKSSMGALYNEYRRRSTDRFSIDSLDAVEDIKVNVVEDVKINPGVFDNLNFDNEFTVSEQIPELPDSFNPRRTSTDLKQRKRTSLNSKQSKKKMEFLNEPLENIGEKVNNAFDESIRSLKCTTNDMFSSLFSNKPFDEIANISGISSIKSGEFYQDEGMKDEMCIKNKDQGQTDEKEEIVNESQAERGEPFIKVREFASDTFTKEKQTNSETFVQEKQCIGETFIQEKQFSSETFIHEKQFSGKTFIQNKRGPSDETSAPSVAWGETFYRSHNVTYHVPTVEQTDLNEAIAPTSVDIPDHVMHNPLKSINEKISSIEFDVIRVEQKIAETVTKYDHHETSCELPEMRLESIPESNESKLPDSSTDGSKSSTGNSSYTIENKDIKESVKTERTSTAVWSIDVSPPCSLISSADSTEKNTREFVKPETKPPAWSIEISPPSKVVPIEEKKQSGAYDFLMKYPQPRAKTRTIRRPSTTRQVRPVPSSTPKVNNKTGSDSLNNTKNTNDSKNSTKSTRSSVSPNETKNSIKSCDSLVIHKSFNSSSSSSDRSKDCSSDSFETSSTRSISSRKRRSNSSVENEAVGGEKKGNARQGPTPVKLLRTSSNLDVFKKPVPKQMPVKQPPPVRKAAGLPMKSLNLTKKVKKPREESVQFYNPEKLISDYTDANLLIATRDSSTPFSVGSLYMDPKVLDDLERDNIKWLNSLLTPPIELECDAEGLWCVDIADLWLKSSRTQNIELAPSRESTAMKYHGQQDRLDALRKAAFQLFRSSSMSPVLSKLSWHISKNLIEVRKDRDLHLDQGLHQRVISLLLCYNPLWLRIGLEAVYGCTVPLHHNNDVLGLTSFMRKHLVNDPYTRKQHAHPKVPNLMDASFADAMKKFILRKFLMIVYFLDRAKSTKLNPCLFNKKSKYKESAQLVIEFSRDVISGGDILRHLRTIDYILEHKQTYLNEFDFSTKTLLDLRDGVRLARAMEIILHQKYLTKRLRAPAISRLQKVHNVEISMNALQDAGYDIQDDISAKDIADGHREKTLSLLWQIIYKFQAPRYDRAARSIQAWWKGKSLFREIRKRIRDKLMAKQNRAAAVIQSKWKGILARRKLNQLKQKLQQEKAQRLAATILIQKTFRRHQDRTRYLRLKNIALKLQRNYRHKKTINTDRDRFVQVRQATVTIQKFWRNYKINQKYRNDYETMKTSVTTIQRWYRNMKVVQQDRQEYLTLRQTVVCIQQRYRATRLMRKTRREYNAMKQSAVLVQRRYRAHQLMLVERKQYNALKKATVEIQTRFRTMRHARAQRIEFLRVKAAALVLQRRYRANKAMRIQRANYLNKKRAAVTIQTRWRCYKLMQTQRAHYVQMKQKVVFVQSVYRANRIMRTVREQYRALIQATRCIQSRYRAYRDMNNTRNEYRKKRQAVVCIQQRYRAQRAMQTQRTDYLKTKQACVVLQTHWRSYQTMKQCRTHYVDLKRNTVLIQNLWRGKQAMRRHKEEFCTMKSKTIVIQKYFRGYLLMKKQRQAYLTLRTSVVKIQEWYRNVKCMRDTRKQYLALRQAALCLQSRYRARLSMRYEQNRYTELRNKTIVIQQHIRAHLEMKKDRNQFNRLKSATILIQRNFRLRRNNRAAMRIQQFYRGYKLMLKQKEEYLTLKRATLTIQTLFRATIVMKQQRDEFVHLKQACVAVQQRWRATLAMRKQKAHYLTMKQKTILIQQWYRNIKLTRLEAKRLQEVKQATLTIQCQFRAQLAMKKQRAQYVALRHATVTIQTRYRATVIGRQQHDEYAALRQAVVDVQRRFRATRLMKVEHSAYTKLREATLTIQGYYRHYTLMKTQRQVYLNLKHAVRVIEERYIANKLMRTEREVFVSMKQAVCVIETRYKATLAMKVERERFLAMKSSVCKIQQWYLTRRQACEERQAFVKLRHYTVMIQRRFRFKLNMRKYERVIELMKLKKEEEKREQYRNECATKIQSLWKMYKVRQKFAAILAKKREEKKSSRQQPFENTAPLYVRLEEAIEGLNVGTDLYCVIKCLYNIDTITTLSPKLCVEFTNKGLIPLLYQYLQRVNRSEPNKILAVGILRVFVNLARFDLTAPILWRVTLMVDGLNTIVDLIKIWYNNNEEIMCAATTLLWLFGMKPDNIQVINSTENLSKKLLYVFTQLDKKKPPSRKGAPPPSLPGTKADWGLGYRRKVFDNPLYAVSTLCQKLGLLGVKQERMVDISNISRISNASSTTGIDVSRISHANSTTAGRDDSRISCISSTSARGRGGDTSRISTISTASAREREDTSRISTASSSSSRLRSAMRSTKKSM
uniref:Protein abnormal spindle n=1 Tax=Cacopsylla melanoneura TaxID=428564 RepID=A0A8D8Z8Y1_9HEMI